MTKRQKDRIFEAGVPGPGSFVFDEKVVRVFPDMISRSVPGYELIVPLIGLLARRYAQPGTRVYDLGCSLGACTLAMMDATSDQTLEFIAVDNAPPMVEACRARLARYSETPVRVACQDLRETDVKNASVVVMNFTLQFIDRADRGPLLAGIARGIVPGGALILAEKVRFDQPRSQQDQTDWHHDFKRAMGYSELEIAAKRTALEKVLEPDTHEQHVSRLLDAGFSRVERWFQCFAFQALIAIK
ncbi:MAG TPA: carboxy-S-adenosyl-L-methionine synthase CmoA [Xanthomonadales bacterium]|nr:carboxy-S-adenosyl-L-methionine synthase CmoA [Xanthomonadales bacterium]